MAADGLLRGQGAQGGPPQSQGRLIGRRYRLMSPVGRGGMGMVWHAHDVLLDRDVAVKELILPFGLDHAGKQVAHRRMLREARSAARLTHPGIVTVHDVVEEDGRPWIVMELVRAWSLEQAVRQSGPLPVAQAAEIGIRVLDALRHAHAAGILHRDVKPGNVLLTADRVVLTDFGIAAIEGDVTITQTGLLMGSPAYIPPERLSGQPITQSADLWSFGATLYAAVEGRPPYEGADAIAVLGAVLTQEPIRPQRAGALLPVIEGLLRKNAAERMPAAQAAEMLERVLRAHGSHPPRARESAPPPIPTPSDSTPMQLLPPLDPPSGPMPSRIVETPSGPVRVPYDPAGNQPGGYGQPYDAMSSPSGSHRTDMIAQPQGGFDAFTSPSGPLRSPSGGYDVLSGQQGPASGASGGPSGAYPTMGNQPGGASGAYPTPGGPSGAYSNQPGGPSGAYPNQPGSSGPYPDLSPDALDDRTGAAQRPDLRSPSGAHPAAPGHASGAYPAPGNRQDPGAHPSGPYPDLSPDALADRPGAGHRPEQRSPSGIFPAPGNAAGPYPDLSPDALSDRSAQGAPSGPYPTFGGPSGPQPTFGGPSGPQPTFGGPSGPQPILPLGTDSRSAGASARWPLASPDDLREHARDLSRDLSDGRRSHAGGHTGGHGHTGGQHGGAQTSPGDVRRRPVETGNGWLRDGRPTPRLIGVAVAGLAAAVVAVVLATSGGTAVQPEDKPVTASSSTPAKEPQSAVTAPKGFKEHTPEGYSAAVPSSWKAAISGEVATFTGPKDSGMKITTEQVSAQADGGLAELSRSEADGGAAGYIQVQLQGVEYRGWKAADWEYTYTLDDVPMHAHVRYVSIDEDTAFKITFLMPELKWDDEAETRKVFLDTFRPTT